jgi:hypothetical protein
MEKSKKANGMLKYRSLVLVYSLRLVNLFSCHLDIDSFVLLICINYY